MGMQMNIRKRVARKMGRGAVTWKQASSKVVPLLSDKEFLIAAAGIAWTGFQLYTNPRRRNQMIQIALTTVLPALLPYLMRRLNGRNKTYPSIK